MKILFVCSGNTCRSPMAEGLFRDMMREKGLSEQVMCQSAGLSPVEGAPASDHAIAVCAEWGIDLSGHSVRKFTGEEIPVWDVIFTMTRTHGYILEQAGVSPRKIYVPEPEIRDPFGGSLEDYRACRDTLRKALEVFTDTCVMPFLSGSARQEDL